MWNYKRRYNKFGNTFTVIGGKGYRSKLEANYSQHLDLLKKAGEIKDYIYEPTFRLEVGGKLICKIMPDYQITHKDGKRDEIHEIKSPATMTPVWVIKWRLMQALYPEYKYVVVQRGDF